MSKRFFFIGTLLVVLGSVLLFGVAQRTLTRYINTPGIKNKIESTASETIGSPVKIGAIKGHIGIRPWVAIEDVQLRDKDGAYILNANRIRCHIRWRPLFKGNVSLSSLLIEKPRLQIMISAKPAPKKANQGFSLKGTPEITSAIPRTSIENAEITVLNPRVSKEPLVQINGNVRLGTKSSGAPIHFEIDGHFQAAENEGDFDIQGDWIADAEKVQATWLLSSLKAGPVRWPRFKGTFLTRTENLKVAALEMTVTAPDVKGAVALEPKRRRWKATLKIDPIILPVNAALLKSMQITPGKVSVNAQWESPNSSPDMSNPFSTRAEWNVDVAISRVDWKGVLLNKLSAGARWDGSKLRVSDLSGELSHGIISGQALFSQYSAAGFQTVSTTASIQGLDLEPISIALSTHPVFLGGRLSVHAQLEAKQQPWTTKAWAGQASVLANAGTLNMSSPLLQLFTALNLNSLMHPVKTHRKTGFSFDVISATATMGGGSIVFAEPAMLRSPEIEMWYRGWIHLEPPSAQGEMIVNALTKSRNLIGGVPKASKLIIGPDGEFIPLVVDIKYENDKLDTNFRSIKTLTGPAVRIMKNVLKLPFSFFGKKGE